MNKELDLLVQASNGRVNAAYGDVLACSLCDYASKRLDKHLLSQHGQLTDDQRAALRFEATKSKAIDELRKLRASGQLLVSTIDLTPEQLAALGNPPPASDASSSSTPAVGPSSSTSTSAPSTPAVGPSSSTCSSPLPPPPTSPPTSPLPPPSTSSSAAPPPRPPPPTGPSTAHAAGPAACPACREKDLKIFQLERQVAQLRAVALAQGRSVQAPAAAAAAAAAAQDPGGAVQRAKKACRPTKKYCKNTRSIILWTLLQRRTQRTQPRGLILPGIICAWPRNSGSPPGIWSF
ncbi:merozoite surface protein CMZ-8-like [Engraulis encrasicolus]|uniref:merozoite surface protein CMZ-8-like n=1 Tax=Engraulis encrasicolus TaxID=184585 RepID=UPI002FD3EB3D